ncbi:MAG: rhodanese-like domain-containing protein [Myxococcales bacterium]|nr:rhodanese-like domain-containing protein [Myxococcales bacterium]
MFFQQTTRNHPETARVEEIDPISASTLDPEVWLVDVREIRELTDPLGHVAGVRHVPMGAVGAAFAEVDRAQPIALICRSGGRSGAAARRLVAMGFERVYNVSGGMMGWNRAGLPVSHDATLGDVR